MKKKSTEFAVGIFALLGLLIIIFMSLKVSRHDAMSMDSHEYFANFDSVSGLIPKIPVEVSGIISGYVESIDLVDNKARLVIKIDKKIKVFDDAILMIRDRGVLGDKFVALNTGSTDKPVIPDGGEIKYTQSQSDFEKLTKTLAETADIIKELVQSDNPKGALGQTIVNLKNMTATLDRMMADNEGNFSEIMENLRSLTAQINAISTENRDEIKNVMESLEKTMASVQDITGKIQRGEGTIGKLVNDDSTINSLNNSLEGLNQTLGLFNRIQLKFRYRGEFLTSSHDMQNLFAIIIAPAPDKYIMVELVDAPQGQTNVVDTVINSGGTTTTTQTIQTDSNITFTIMFAKRFWDATLRVGLIRSQGGVGLDYHFFKDRLILTAETYDLDRPNNKPVVRLYGTLYVYRHLIMTGGVDDMLNDLGPRNPFVGIGLQFTDNDFKALIPALRGGM